MLKCKRSLVGGAGYWRLVLTCLAFTLTAMQDFARAASSVPSLAAPPDLVTEPAVNLGFTSFYDGFAKFTPGLAFIDYTRWQDLTSLTTSKGTEVPGLNNPNIQAFINLLQFFWVAPIHVPGGGVGFDVLLPLVELSSSFTQPGGNLRANGFATGDLNFGPFYQSAPMKLFGHLFSWRTEFDIIAPSGGFNPNRDINQSSGFWSLNPYVAFTYLPVGGWEISARIWYLHNFTTNRISNPPFNPQSPIETGQAGDAAWINFTSSYAISKPFALGLNGYYFQQLGDDKVNGQRLAHTIKNQVYLGPGVHWEISKTNIVNFNVYVPVTTHGVATGPQLNLQYIHPF